MAPDKPSPQASTVTVERAYFETLVRRAQFNSQDVSLSQSMPNDAVTVSRTSLEALHLIARQHENLRRNLLRGGVVEETIALLSQDDNTIQSGQSSRGPADTKEIHRGGNPISKSGTPGSPYPPSAAPRRKSFVGSSNGHGYQQSNAGARHHEQDWADADATVDENSCSVDAPADDTPVGDSGPASGTRPHYERQCVRTVLLANLPDGTTHADITSVVRGGLVLDIFLRSNDRSATVSFLNEADARAFFEHARRHDLYVKHKRVEVRWSERQFILAGHVASKIAIGATRNLVVRRCDPRITEGGIREDLEHIHNLVVVKVEFAGGSCFISTNSVHNAMFARTCMMSRFKFKGSKIDWDVDECAQPFQRLQAVKPRREAPPPRKPTSAVTNRFGLLNIDDGEDDDDEAASDFPVKEAVGIVA